MDSYIYFGFAIPEGECEMVLSDLNTGEIVTATFDSEDCEPIYVGEIESAEVTLTTENVHTYCGTWQAQQSVYFRSTLFISMSPDDAG